MRVIAYGYRSFEVKQLGNIETWDAKVKILNVRYPHERVQMPEMVSLGFHLDGICAPHVDTRDPDTLRDGVCFRMGKEMPDRRPGFLKELKQTTLEWLRENLSPLDCNSDSSFETWLEGTSYDLTRKQELRKIHEDVIVPLERKGGKLKHFIIKLFAKDEQYVAFKHARGIYARDDIAKVYFGPWFKMIENKLYENPTFIKHIPVAQRAEYIYERLYREGSVYVQTDYSSYEAHFDKPLMEHCEFQLYDYMLSTVDGSAEVLSTMRTVLTGTNRVFNKNLDCLVKACRMSGEMNTSLGNGFSNYMLMLNQCNLMGLQCVGVVEGDDGLFVFPSSSKPCTEDFTSSGCIIKLEVFDKISHASFCGLLFDEEDRQIVADIRKLMATIGWSSKQYVGANKKTHLALLRCKAMSMIVQYPSCPVVAAMARSIIRLTRHISVRKIVDKSRFDLYTRDKLLYGIANFKHNLNAEIGLGTRLLVDELWGFSLELQFRLEKYFDSLVEIGPIPTELFQDLFPRDWITYYENFVVEQSQQLDVNRTYVDQYVS